MLRTKRSSGVLDSWCAEIHLFVYNEVMRLWSLHPKYLDAKGLVALWREALLAQKVLLGETRGYRHHPQLYRFLDRGSAISDIGAYLKVVADEADRRGYKFDRNKIKKKNALPLRNISVTRDQIHYEWCHLLKKVKKRAPEHYKTLFGLKRFSPHPLFRVIAGGIADWEKR